MNGKVFLILVVTSIFIAGQFTQYPFIAAVLRTRLDASPTTIAAFLAVYGLAGVFGSTLSAAAIDRLGAPRTATVSLGAVIIGLGLWVGSGGSLVFAGLGLAVWGCGGGPLVSAQQARLIAADPRAASVSVALNTSVLYAGQAIGTSIGGELMLRAEQTALIAAGISLILVALIVSLIAELRWRG
jgi:predicted MFS family arabinose efflux permease